MNKLTKESKIYILKLLSVLILSLILSFLAGFFITSTVNNQNSYYQVTFTYSGNKDLSNIVSKDYLQSIKNTDANKYSTVDVDKLIDKSHFTIEKIDDEYIIKTKAKYYADFFFSKQQRVATRAESFIKLTLNNFVDSQDEITYKNKNVVELKNHFSPYLGGCIGLPVGVIASLILFNFIKKEENENIEDNKTLYKTPFHLSYWKESLNTFKDTKKMVSLAMIFSLLLVSKFFILPSGFGNLGIGFGFIFLSIIGLMYGPTTGLIIGALSDIIGYFITPQTGPFNFGFTIQAALAAFTYGLTFYKTKLSFSKIILSRIITNLLLNVILGSYLQCLIFVKGGTITNELFFETLKIYMLTYSLPKNLLTLIPQSIVLFIIFKAILPVLVKFNYIDNKVKNISLI